MSARIFRALPAAALALLFFVSACSTGGAATDDRPPDERPRDVDLSQYEDFDPRPYREDAPGETGAGEEVEHDVPARLLSGEADAGTEQTVQGFRVQIFSSRDRDAAERASAQAEQWWSSNADAAPAGLFADGLPTYTVFRQPYYRVRVGNFADRAEAERALSFLQQRYGDAFIARSEVTVTR